MEEILCPITGQKANGYQEHLEGGQKVVSYSITVGNNPTHTCKYKVPLSAMSVGMEDRTMRPGSDPWINNKWFNKNKYLLGYAMENGLSLFEESEVITLPLIKQRLAASVIPHTPRMKLDHLLKFIADEINTPGETYEIDFSKMSRKLLLRKLYLQNLEELDFYASTLYNEGLVKYEQSGAFIFFGLTFAGLSYLANLEDAGAQSKNCFVAMAFDDSRKKHRAAIVKAIIDCGYDAVIVDTGDIDSDKTINDQIIADIRRCKFCISDFTLQRTGVYFEAGFALGLGKPVIYVCDGADFKNSHFDLKPFQHLIYNSPEELHTGLVRKIQAWIQ